MNHMWKTTEYTEYTEENCFFSVYSVVSQANRIAAKPAAISAGPS